MKQGRSGTGRASGVSVMRAVLLRVCSVLAAALLTVTSAAAGTAGETWEERLEKAREKYNKKTVNVYVYGRGQYKRGKINVYFYKVKEQKHMSINIRESLEITDEAEMEAILELVADNKNYQEEIYGSIPFMKAQWIAHNMAHDMANGNSEQQQAVEMLIGESAANILSSSKRLDLSPLEDISDSQRRMYEIVEFLLVTH